MSESRTDRLISLPERAAQRLAHRMAAVADRFPQPVELSLSLEDAMQEKALRGHFFDENCTSPFCIQAGQMLKTGMEQAFAGVMGAQNG